MRRPKHLLKIVAKSVFAAADPLFGRFPGPRILIYHQVGVDLGREMEVSTETFRRHLDWMQARGEIVDLETAIERRGEPDSNKLFVLTFDDGFEDVYQNAFPLLKERELPFTLYLTTSPIETGEPLDPRYPAARPFTWDQVNEMAATELVTIGAHTHTHRDLRSLPSAEIVIELDTSNQLIEERTGTRPKHFTYPWGDWVPEADPLVRQRYDTATLGSGDGVTGTSEPHMLHRVPVQRSDGLAFFRRKLLAGMRLEGRVRRRIRRRKDNEAAATRISSDGPRDLGTPLVVHVIDSLTAAGGAENRLVDEVIQMRGLRHVVVRLFESAALEPRLLEAGIPVVNLGLRSARGIRDFPLAIWRLRGLLRRYRPNVIHSSLFMGNLVAQVTAATFLPRIPVVSTLTRTEDGRDEGRLFNRGGARSKVALVGWLGRSCRRMRHVRHRAVGESVKASACSNLGLDPHKVEVISRGIDTAGVAHRARSAAGRAQFGLPEGPLVVNVGRLAAPKGQVFLIRAFRLVVDRIPRAVLAIAGERQDAAAEVEAEIVANGLSDSVYLLGQRGDADELLGLAQVFGMSSLSEGSPGVVLEAMAAGCPVVGFDIPSVRELSDDGRWALLVPKGDVEALAGAVLQMLERPARRSELTSAARIGVATEYDLAAIVDRVEGLLIEASSER